jgi:chemotaxis protein MotB
MRQVYFYSVLIPILALSCVSTGKFNAMQKQAHQYDSLYTWSMQTLKTCQDANADLTKQRNKARSDAGDMNTQLTATKENNALLRKELQQLSDLSAAQAESIKKSIDNIGAKDLYMQALHSALARRDSMNLAVLMNLKAALGSFGDSDANVKLDKGIVHVDFSDKLLFGSDSNTDALSGKGRTALARLARALNDQPGLDFSVEAHTDSIPQDSLLASSWDLSTKRAVAIVRILQIDYHVAPERMIAAGYGEYSTVAPNDTPENRAANRRTRISVRPPMEELMQLLERRQIKPGAPAASAPSPSASANPTSANPTSAPAGSARAAS